MQKYREIERSIIKTYRKAIWRRFIRGINDYKMINEGDKIAVCVSGGKDSMLAAKCAQEIQRHGVVPFGLEFVTAYDADAAENPDKVMKCAEYLNIPLTSFEHSGSVKDALVNKAVSLGCNKIAYGSHFDDAIESALGNMLQRGRAEILLPKELLPDCGIEIIRPLYYVKEKDIRAWAARSEADFAKDDEPDEIKELVRRLRRTSQYIDKNIMSSFQDVNLSTLIGYRLSGEEYNFLDDYDEKP